MPKVEISRTKIVKRLVAEGWQNEGGGKHDLYRKGGHLIAVPRHRTLSPGVARSIARAAGWL